MSLQGRSDFEIDVNLAPGEMLVLIQQVLDEFVVTDDVIRWARASIEGHDVRVQVRTASGSFAAAEAGFSRLARHLESEIVARVPDAHLMRGSTELVTA